MDGILGLKLWLMDEGVGCAPPFDVTAPFSFTVPQLQIVAGGCLSCVPPFQYAVPSHPPHPSLHSLCLTFLH